MGMSTCVRLYVLDTEISFTYTSLDTVASLMFSYPSLLCILLLILGTSVLSVDYLHPGNDERSVCQLCRTKSAGDM